MSRLSGFEKGELLRCPCDSNVQEVFFLFHLIGRPVSEKVVLENDHVGKFLPLKQLWYA